MSNTKLFGGLIKGVAITLLGMMAIAGVIVRPIVRQLDVNENFVSSVTSIMVAMGIVATICFVVWFMRLARKMESAINPGLVDPKSKGMVLSSAVVSIIIYGVMAIANIGLDDWGALMLSTVIGVLATIVASILLGLAMNVCLREI